MVTQKTSSWAKEMKTQGTWIKEPNSEEEFRNYELLTWLLSKAKKLLKNKDKESGWTALHKAIFYGQIASAVLLIKNGACLTVKDNEGHTPIDLCTKDHIYLPFVQTNKEIGEYNVYTWGDNSSYALGHGKESQRQSPEVIETFRRKRITIKQVVMSRYHSVYLTTTGTVYTCGHGRGGRLGLGHEEPTLQPYLVKLPQTLQATAGGAGDTLSDLSMSTVKIESIAAGWDHTILLGANGRAYSFGDNKYKQLGISPEPLGSITEPRMASIVNFKVLAKGPPIKHIAAARFHTLLATESTVYAMGLNAGQLGHPKGDTHIPPSQVTSVSNQTDSRVHLMACSDACSVIVMSGERREGFYILYKYTTRFINFRGAKFDHRIRRLCVSGGQVDHTTISKSINEINQSDCNQPLRVFWINPIGQLLLWTEDGIRRVVYPTLGRQLSMLDVSSNLSEVLVTTEEGGAYVLTASEKASVLLKEQLKFSSSVPTIDMKIRRIGGVHRATQCSIDPKSSNYALLQAKEYTCTFAEVRPSKMSENLYALLTEADEMDGVADVILTCSGERIACHKFLLASRSAYFNKLLLAVDNSIPTSVDQQMDEYMPFSLQELCVDAQLSALRFILRYIYTGVSNHSLLFDGEFLHFDGSKRNFAKCMQWVVEDGLDIPRRGNKSKHDSAVRREKEKERTTRVHEIGKKFGVKTLSALKSGSSSPISYTLSNHTQWCDVVLISLDDRELLCH
ncbi:inhibitor of Bruton tyrosine kinase-like [Watersipora subatra]|uniref:inhibitor of Bruton tyrosine kinase-like n=1 Tax=Watersipora subatra TaxID=2589382 RepID=UPI00355ACFB9